MPQQPVFYVAQTDNSSVNSVEQTLYSDVPIYVNGQLDRDMHVVDYSEKCLETTSDIDYGSCCISDENDMLSKDSGLGLDHDNTICEGSDACQISDIDFVQFDQNDQNDISHNCSISHDNSSDVLNIVAMSQPFYSGNRTLVKIGNSQIEGVLDTGSCYSLVSKRLIHTVPIFSKCVLQKSTIPELYVCTLTSVDLWSDKIAMD